MNIKQNIGSVKFSARKELFNKVNSEQLQAIQHRNGSLLIIAGAGTGKTTVITQKIAWLLEKKLAKSDEILALTFTEKAATEMEERVDKIVPLGYTDIWISTFHSFAERILKEHGLDIGLSNDFKLFNEFEQWALVKQNLNKFDLDYYRPLGNPTKFIKAMLKHFSRLKDENIDPETYIKYAEGLKLNLDKAEATGNSNIKLKNDKELINQEIFRLNEIANAYHTYQQLLLDNNALDFGDLINYCLKIFKKRRAILEKYRQQFKYILVDEFQDTNWAQYELVKILATKQNNLTVVADDDQSIYRFRGAAMSNVLQFKKDYPECKNIVLIKNYRSQQNILDLSYDFIKLNNPNRLEYQLSKLKNKSEKINKKLVAQNKGKGIIEVIKGADLQDEIRQIIEKIIKLKEQDKEATWNDFAILIRANESAKEFIANLDNANLPYIFLASKGLYSKPAIMDVIAYLRLLDNYHESSALYRVLNMPIFDFDYQTLVNFNYWARRKSWSLYEVITKAANLNINQEVLNKVNYLISLIEKHTILARTRSAKEVVIAFLQDSGYIDKLVEENEQKSLEVINYLNQFIKRIEVFEANNEDKSVKSFLQELEMEIEAGEQGSLPFNIESGPEAIKILTVHSAKGLEFKYVFIPNLVDKRFPTIERKEPIEIPNDLVREIVPEASSQHLEEERRLFYVAMTRAKYGLYFSWAEDYGGQRKKKPSLFLQECGLLDKSKNNKSYNQTSISKFLNPLKKLKDNKDIRPKFTIPNYFSFTQLSAFQHCPYQYYLSHIIKIPTQGKAVFSFGKTMHLTLQKWFELLNKNKTKIQSNLFDNKPKVKQNYFELKDLLKIYKDNWIDDWYGDKIQLEKYKKKGINILKEFFNKNKNNWPETLGLEQGFSIKINNQEDKFYTVKGKIDRIDIMHYKDGKEKIKIIDYKTGEPKNNLNIEDKEQLLLYQLAVKELYPDKEIEKLQYYYLNNNTKVEFLGSETELNKLKQKIIDIIEQIKKSDFPPKPGALCKFCDFNKICEYKK